MLYLIGLGLDKDDLSVKSLKIIKKCKEVFLESYTSIFPYSVRELEKEIGKVTLVDRNFVEEATSLISLSKKKKVALLIYGDPLIATTHIALLQEAQKQKVKAEIIHNISVLNAVVDTGLETYKFGRIASIPKWKKNYSPRSFVDILRKNMSIDAHTLFLLDLDLSLNDALSYLLQTKGVLKKTLCVACSSLGTSKQKIISGTVEKVMKKRMVHPVCLIVPSKLHFVERDYLKKFSV